MVRPTITKQVLTSGPKEIKGHTGYLSFGILMWKLDKLWDDKLKIWVISMKKIWLFVCIFAWIN